jgi:hypothetical protein
MTTARPAWKIWHPLSFWKVLGMFTITNLVAVVLVVALREGAGLDVPMAIAGGVGGGTGAMWTGFVAARARAREEQAKDE